MRSSSVIARKLRNLTLALTCLTRVAEGQSPDWTQPFPPFRIAGNLYYVGSKGLASYLVTTSQGHILINSNLTESVPQIRASVEQLGFRFTDIRVLGAPASVSRTNSLDESTSPWLPHDRARRHL